MRTLYAYAIEYRYGKHIQGHETLLRFRSRADRDAWVNAGPFGVPNAFYREAVDSRHPDVRRARAAVRAGHQWEPVELLRAESMVVS